jgi:hypothetical protein
MAAVQLEFLIIANRLNGWLSGEAVPLLWNWCNGGFKYLLQER